MKKLLLTVAVLLSPVVLEAGHYRYGSGRSACRSSCAPVTSCATVCPTSCTPVCPTQCEEPCPPKCFKTIMVPQTIQVPKQVEVQPRKIVMPQADIVERIPQPPIEVRIPQPPIPQPDRIEFKCVPDQIRYHKQCPLIRWECPVDSECRPC